MCIYQRRSPHQRSMHACSDWTRGRRAGRVEGIVIVSLTRTTVRIAYQTQGMLHDGQDRREGVRTQPFSVPGTAWSDQVMLEHGRSCAVNKRSGGKCRHRQSPAWQRGAAGSPPPAVAAAPAAPLGVPPAHPPPPPPPAPRGSPLPNRLPAACTATHLR